MVARFRAASIRGLMTRDAPGVISVTISAAIGWSARTIFRRAIRCRRTTDNVVDPLGWHRCHLATD